jgi:hypothetical protein
LNEEVRVMLKFGDGTCCFESCWGEGEPQVLAELVCKVGSAFAEAGALSASVSKAPLLSISSWASLGRGRGRRFEGGRGKRSWAENAFLLSSLDNLILSCLPASQGVVHSLNMLKIILQVTSNSCLVFDGVTVLIPVSNIHSIFQEVCEK